MERLQDKLHRLADDLAEYIYPLTFKFPLEERFALADQIRRAVLSVPINLVEGFCRKTDKDKKHFMIIAISSLEELKYEIYFAHKRSYINKETFLEFTVKCTQLSKLLGSFIKTLGHINNRSSAKSQKR